MCASRSSSYRQLVTALVVLQHGPASGEAAVAANIDELRPPRSMVDEVTRAFAESGFRVSECVGNSFSIEAPVSRFHEFFKIKLSLRPDGSVRVIGRKGVRALELPLGSLPKRVQLLVRAVTFSEPLAFGPGGTGP